MTSRRVLLVDDHALFRAGIASLLRAGGMDVCGQAGDGEEAIKKARELRPDLILMDVSMPGISGLDAARTIKAELPDTRVVMLTVSDDEQHLFDAINNGADGYILKDTPGDDFSELLSRLFEGEPAMSKGLASLILQEFRRAPKKTPQSDVPGESLSERETEVIRLAAEGLTNREISERIFISESTVNYHMRNVFSKLQLRNRAEAVAYAARKNLLRDPEDK